MFEVEDCLLKDLCCLLLDLFLSGSRTSGTSSWKDFSSRNMSEKHADADCKIHNMSSKIPLPQSKSVASVIEIGAGSKSEMIDDNPVSIKLPAFSFLSFSYYLTSTDHHRHRKLHAKYKILQSELEVLYCGYPVLFSNILFADDVCDVVNVCSSRTVCSKQHHLRDNSSWRKMTNSFPS